MTICREGLNKMWHKTHPKLQKLLQSKATASHAFPTMPNWAREAPETQEVRESKSGLIQTSPALHQQHTLWHNTATWKGVWIYLNCTRQDLIPDVLHSNTAHTSPEITPNFTTPLQQLVLIFTHIQFTQHENPWAAMRKHREKLVLMKSHGYSF